MAFYTIESPNINTVPFLHTSESEMEVNQFGILFSKTCLGTQILFLSKLPQFLFSKSLALAISVANSCIAFSR